MSAIKRGSALPHLFGLLPLLLITVADASDNSNSTLDVFQLLVEAGSRPISHTPPPAVIIRVKPPSLDQLEQQLADDYQVLAEQEPGLASAQSELNFWLTQPAEVADINVPQWQAAVAADQALVDRLQAEIAQLSTQINALINAAH